MTPPKFDYDIHITSIPPPPSGGLTHAAKVVGLTRRNPDGTVSRLAAPFGEEWGHDRSEAAQKVHARMDAWIAAQG
jgi:hypothetical protein